MEFPAYEGGSGGKFRRRTFRRPPATPYDRPPSAARGLRGLSTSAGSGSGWFSKLVDPASRFIAGSTSRLFSTVFRKRLPAPTEVQVSEQDCQVKLYGQAVDVVPFESQIPAAVDGHNPIKDLGTSGITEIEQLLKQKKYTRDQVDYLTRLISSRTLEPGVQQSESNETKVIVSDEWNKERSTSLNKKLSKSETALIIPPDVAATPAQIARAYMGSRPPKASSSSLSLQSGVFQKDKCSFSSGSYAPRLHDLSVVPRSVLHISEANKLSNVGYPTSKSHGRSAMYRMSRSPYLKANPAVNMSEYARSINVGWSPGKNSNSSSRQVLKRDSSFLDSEDGSFGPIRRIRHKSGLIFDSPQSQFLPSSSSHSPSFLHLDKVDLKDPNSSEKPNSLNELMYASTYSHNIGNVNGKIFPSNFPPVPRQSSEACRKILEQLDKFSPSQEEKSNMRSISRDELPTKLTADMLNGRARRSMDNVSTSQFTSMDEIDSSDYKNVVGLDNFGGSPSETMSKERENGPSKLDATGVNFESAANGISKQDIFGKTSMPSFSSTGATDLFHAIGRLQRKPAFQMTAPEDLLVDDEQDAVDVSALSTLGVVKNGPKIAENNASSFGMLAPDNSFLPPSKNLNVSTSVSLPEISKKSYNVSIVSEDSSSGFPVANEPLTFSSPTFAPTMPFPSHDKLVSQKENTVPKFMLGSQNSGTSFQSSTTAMSNESSMESKPELSWPGGKIQLKGSNLFSDEKSEEASMHKSPGVVSSGQSTLGNTDAIAFGTTIASTQSNNSVHSSSLTSFLLPSTSEAILKSPVTLFSSNSKLIEASSSSLPLSNTSPVIASTTMFSGAVASTAAPVSVSFSSEKSVSVDSEGTPLRSSNPPTMQVASPFVSAGNSNTSLMGSSPFPHSGSSPPATKSTPAVPAIFSQVSSSAPGFAASSSSSSQTSNTGLSAANGSSQNSSTKFGFTGGSIFGVQPVQSGSSALVLSQSSKSQLGSFSSSATLGSSSSSWPSSSTFGLNGASSTEFVQVPFGTTNQSAKSFGSTSGFPFTSGPPNGSNSGFSFSSGTSVSSTSSPFPSISSASNSSSGLSSSTNCITLNSGFSFSAGASSSSQAGNTLSQATTSGFLNSSSHCSTSSISNSVLGSSSTGFSFGHTAPASSVSSFPFGSSSGPAFSFTSSDASMTAATALPNFGMSSTSGLFSSASPNNDQMNVEDTMADDTNQISGPIFPAFGQLSSTPASTNFMFGSATQSAGPSIFQFGNQQNPSIPQNQNPFQAGGNLEFSAGGSFSLGSGGGEKPVRKIVRVRRDKNRRK